MLGLGIGTLILPPTPSLFRRRIKAQGKTSTKSQDMSSNGTYLSNDPISENAPRQLGKSAIELCAYVVVWWTLFGGARWMGGGRDSVSRRLVRH